MQSLGNHDRIVRYIGSPMLELGPAVIMEYCELGDLLSFLRRTLKHAKTEVFSVKETKTAKIIYCFLDERTVTVSNCKRKVGMPERSLTDMLAGQRWNGIIIFALRFSRASGFH